MFSYELILSGHAIQFLFALEVWNLTPEYKECIETGKKLHIKKWGEVMEVVRTKAFVVVARNLRSMGLIGDDEHWTLTPKGYHVIELLRMENQELLNFASELRQKFLTAPHWDSVPVSDERKKNYPKSAELLEELKSEFYQKRGAV